MLETKVTFTDTEPILEAIKKIAEQNRNCKYVDLLHEMLFEFVNVATDKDRQEAVDLIRLINNFFFAIDKNTNVEDTWT